VALNFVTIPGVDPGNCSKEYLYQCLVRDVIKKRIANRDAAFEFMGKWEMRHDNSTLREDVMKQWQKGNRGRKDEWYE
jgi:hypothetical protein